MQVLLSKIIESTAEKPNLVNELNSEYEALREKSGLLKRETVSLEEAQKNKLNLFLNSITMKKIFLFLMSDCSNSCCYERMFFYQRRKRNVRNRKCCFG